MSSFPVVKGLRMRVTRVDACGKPLVGPSSRAVTSGFITAQVSPQMRDAEDLEQNNAEGRLCVSDRTPPERKWHQVTIEMCAVNSCLFSLMTGMPLVLDWEGNPIGYSDQKSVRSDRGVAIEIWSGVGSDDQCEMPTTDDILAPGAAASALPYGYLLLPAVREFTLGDLEIGASVSTFTLTGITGSGARWGMGPYNVMATDASNTAGRLLTPITSDQHLRHFKTTIAPPEVTDDCCGLILPTPYYGPDPVEVAPAQPACGLTPSNEVQTVTITGSPTGGTFTLTFDGETTGAIAHNAANTAVQSALAALPNIGTGNITVTGSAGGPYVCTFTGELAGYNLPTMSATGSFTGGTTPSVAVAVTTEGGSWA